MASEEKVKVGLVGAGWIGQHHGTNVAKNPNAELAAICDADTAKAKAFAEKLGVKALVYGKLEDLLKQDDIRTIVIASPNAAHAAQAVAAAQAGRNFYVEKPLAITLVALDGETIREKARIIRLHKSQMEVMLKIGPDFADMAVERARITGERVGAPYAEAFRPCLASRRTPLASMLP